MPQKFSIRASLVANSNLAPQVKNGMGAIKRSDTKLFDTSVRREIGDSIDLDAAMEANYPHDNRWDYLLSVPARTLLVAVEPHPARDSELSVVIAKKSSAKAHLRDHLLPNKTIDRWFWVCRGRVGFSTMERAKRLLDQNGIAFAGRLLRSID